MWLLVLALASGNTPYLCRKSTYIPINTAIVSHETLFRVCCVCVCIRDRIRSRVAFHVKHSFAFAAYVFAPRPYQKQSSVSREKFIRICCVCVCSTTVSETDSCFTWNITRTQCICRRACENAGKQRSNKQISWAGRFYGIYKRQNLSNREIRAQIKHSGVKRKQMTGVRIKLKIKRLMRADGLKANH